jgi:hypothetical protein
VDEDNVCVRATQSRLGWPRVNEGVRRFGAASKTSLVPVFRPKLARTLLRYLRTPWWRVVRKSLLYPPIELHGHRGSAWRVIKCVPLVTDFMGRVYIFFPDTDVLLHEYRISLFRIIRPDFAISILPPAYAAPA